MDSPVPPFSYFGPTRLIFGPGVVLSAGGLAAEMGIRSVTLVSGSGATRSSPGFAALEESLAKAGIETVEFCEVTADPGAELVRKAAAALAGRDAVVAYGGGSPIDCAKSAALMAANPGVDILDFVYGRIAPASPALPIIAVPTTAGTGSEMSSAAVTTDRATGRKLGLSQPSYFPRLAIVDPETHVSMPPRVTAATGMDALTHAIESYLSLASNPLTGAINLRAIGLIARSLPAAYARPGDMDARSGMATASSMAGLAFSQTGLGMVHGFAHPVGARFGVAHGDANAVILPYVLAALARDAAPGMRDIAEAMGACPAGSSPDKGAEALVAAIVDLKAALGIAPSLSAFGIGEQDAPAILADALTYRNRPKSPRAFSDAELERLLSAAITGDIRDSVKM